MKNLKFVAFVCWAYDNGANKKGDVVSRHKSIDAANKAANKSTFYKIKYLND